MRRMLFYLSSAASLILLSVVVVLWVRSYWVADFVARMRQAVYTSVDPREPDLGGGGYRRAWLAESAAGGILLQRQAYGWETEDPSPAYQPAGGAVVIPLLRGRVPYLAYPQPFSRPPLNGELRRVWGCRWASIAYEREWSRRVTTRRFPAFYGGHTWTVIVPHGLLALPLSVLPWAWWRRWRTTRRRAGLGPGFHCAKCGYDLRATPKRCPECGTAATPSGAAA